MVSKTGTAYERNISMTYRPANIHEVVTCSRVVDISVPPIQNLAIRGYTCFQEDVCMCSFLANQCQLTNLWYVSGCVVC